jgi:hypothetical protein
LNPQLDILLRRDEQIRANLQQLEFEATQEVYRVVQVDRASAPKVPTDNNRFKYMAVAPWCVLFIVLAGCLLKPVEDDRINLADADRPADANTAT